ncbi:MAG: hypothetical protein Q9170_001861 [Blastenia crenularia]
METFFKELYELDEPDESSGDVTNLLATIKASRPSLPRTSLASLRRQLTHPSRDSQPVRRTVSAPLIKTPLPNVSPNEPVVIEDTPVRRATTRVSDYPLIDGPSIPRSNADAHPHISADPVKMLAGTNKKRKRGKSEEVLPEAQQIFKGLRFYFIPNDDVSPARKLRIKKAVERGATWIKEWQEGITHVIVDRHLSYNDILKFLQLSSMPVCRISSAKIAGCLQDQSSMVVVNELYPAECIQFQMLVNPNQRAYQVQGRQEKSIPNQKENMIASTKSLPLKPEKGVTNQPGQTPTRTEPSQQSSGEQPPAENITSSSPLIAPGDILPSLESQDRLPDALDEAIQETIAVKDLPLDDDDEASPRSSMIRDPDSDDSEKEADPSKVPNTTANKPWQAKFSCMTKHTKADNQENPNARTIEILQQMSDYYDRTKDHWRTLAYRRAITALKRQPRKITTAASALAIPAIGARLADKIEEIVLSDRLRRLENTGLDDRDTALQLFLSIYGVGTAQASQWIDRGYRTLADLVAKASLTKNQKIGIDHISDFAARIPREEVERHGKLVRDAVGKVDSSIEVTIGGSYRRGAADSGDVDFIVTKPGAGVEVLRTITLDAIIPRLFASGYLKASLAAGTSRSSGSKWHGCACLPSSASIEKKDIWRRIDFLLVPHDEIGAALIYFTGNDIFNRSIRLLASKKGYRLNQHGLWRDVMRGRARERITQGSLVEGRSERRIFEILGVPWRPPEHRIC